MPSLILLMIAGAAMFAYWNAARAAAERAEKLGRDACKAADVLWLDQTVHAHGLRVRRGEDGKLGFERSFRFEYSYDGIDRHIGRLVLRGEQLVSFIGPVRPSVAPLER
ncbi:DUF3301 domain-containing protein [Pseudoxanthomonas wuyuanensis]|uniref:DUF3301 domain-containing protein n=1 Tax=Pseudoxanthomonas wuyuanensis TaxID=1073196 RepID=A0A286DCW0_9GAMM|nr:DUF3301 domain-containing protein [Pseudoxanthomonas wuyuanensis]KAF1720754.1 DUF3301 domain-containing protein [Pseudoxanthomonas wuyuanensis]SOD56495.1 Protein of unknown function [Pseudoxanthomonas wuyuanensis]